MPQPGRFTARHASMPGTQGMRLFASFLIGSINLIGCATIPPPETQGRNHAGSSRQRSHLDAARPAMMAMGGAETSALPETHAMCQADLQQRPVAMCPWYPLVGTPAPSTRSFAETHRAEGRRDPRAVRRSLWRLPPPAAETTGLAARGPYGVWAAGTRRTGVNRVPRARMPVRPNPAASRR